MGMNQVVAAIPLGLIDFRSMGPSVTSLPRDPVQAVFGFVASELEAVGGLAVLEVDDDGMFCVWDPPSGPGADGRRVTYVAHMLQAGLSRSHLAMVANTAYSGMGIPLAKALLVINPLNGYVAERDTRALADAMPLSAEAWLAHGIVLMENGKFRDAVGALGRSSMLGDGSLAFKCLAVCLTGRSARKALAAAEGMVTAYAREGKVLDVHARAAYGFALLAAGLRKEAEAQFDAGFGQGLPRMTPGQWREWGVRVSEENLGDALADPRAFAPARRSRRPKGA